MMCSCYPAASGSIDLYKSANLTSELEHLRCFAEEKHMSTGISRPLSLSQLCQCHWQRYGVLLALGGRSSPDLKCSGGLSPGPFCVEFACSPRVHKGFPPHRTPTQKHAKRSLSCPVLDQDWTEHLAWSPCAVKGCPLLLEPLEEGQGLQDGLKAEGKFHRRPHQHACVCVCVLCRRQMHVCGVVCCVIIKQTLTFNNLLSVQGGMSV